VPPDGIRVTGTVSLGEGILSSVGVSVPEMAVGEAGLQETNTSARTISGSKRLLCLLLLKSIRIVIAQIEERRGARVIS